MTIKRILRILAVVAAILLIPLILTIRDGGVEDVGWNWTASDFVLMGGLLFVTGLAIEFVLAHMKRPMHRILAVSLIILAFLAVWTELAVGAVSQLLAFLIG